MNNTHTYQPPCTITPRVAKVVADISEAIGRLGTSAEVSMELWLRRINHLGDEVMKVFRVKQTD